MLVVLGHRGRAGILSWNVVGDVALLLWVWSWMEPGGGDGLTEYTDNWHWASMFCVLNLSIGTMGGGGGEHEAMTTHLTNLKKVVVWWWRRSELGLNITN